MSIDLWEFSTCFNLFLDYKSTNLFFYGTAYVDLTVK